jgi:anti-anti-sigma factor
VRALIPGRQAHFIHFPPFPFRPQGYRVGVTFYSEGPEESASAVRPNLGDSRLHVAFPAVDQRRTLCVTTGRTRMPIDANQSFHDRSKKGSAPVRLFSLFNRSGWPTKMMGDGADTRFGLTTSFAGFEAILTLHGEVDLTSAPELSVHLDHAIDQGRRFVVLDLAGLEFIDDSGLAVIGTSAQRLAQSGGALSIRSPSAMVRRLLALVGLLDLVRVEPQETASQLTDVERFLDLPASSPSAKSSGLSGYLRRVTALPSNDEVVNDALRLVVALSRATVVGADGASVSLRRRDRLSTVAASNQTILDMDAGQYQTREGPCVDASVSGDRILAEFLDTESRWPAFTPKARALGINAILSSPLVVRNTPVGALNIYSRKPAAFAIKDQDLASVFANEASVLLSRAQADVTDDQLDGRLGEALRTRELISQAQGIIMEREGVGEHAAYTTLRRTSMTSGTPLRERAQYIVSSVRRHQADDGPDLGEDDHA